MAQKYTIYNCYNLPLHTYNENIFHRQQNFKLASGTHADLILIRDKKKQRNMSKIANKKEITKDRKNLLPY